MAESDQDFFKVLGVSWDASIDQIKRAHRDLVKRVNTDTGWEPDEERYKEVNRAWEILCSSASREQHRANLGQRKAEQDHAKRSEEKKRKATERAPTDNFPSSFGAAVRGGSSPPQPPSSFTPPPSPPPPPQAPPPAPSSGPKAVHEPDGSVIVSLGLVLAAIAFLACPFFIMDVLVRHSGMVDSEGNITSLGANLFLLVVGPVCAIWAFAGLAAVVVSVFRLLAAIAVTPDGQVRPAGALLLLGLGAGVVIMFVQGKAWPVVVSFSHLFL